MTADLVARADWVWAAGCPHVALEATGVSWIPIWNLLEDRFGLVLTNPRHSTAVPGGTTDGRDCAWIADLRRPGLVRGSYVPDRSQRDVREFTRSRTTLVRERTAEANRLQQTLEGANITLAAVATDMLGHSGRQILQAVRDGATAAAALAQLAKGRLRATIPELERAVVGSFGGQQRCMVAQQLAPSDYLNAAIEQVRAAMAERLRPYAAMVEQRETIPGIGRSMAEAVLRAIGPARPRFPSGRPLASWAGMCPGNDRSAGCPLGEAAQGENP